MISELFVGKIVSYREIVQLRNIHNCSFVQTQPSTLCFKPCFGHCHVVRVPSQDVASQLVLRHLLFNQLLRFKPAILHSTAHTSAEHLPNDALQTCVRHRIPASRSAPLTARTEDRTHPSSYAFMLSKPFCSIERAHKSDRRSWSPQSPLT